MSATARSSAAGASSNLVSLSDGNHQTTALTQTLAKEDTRVVNVLRIAVLSVLVITATVVSTGVYLYTRNDERHAFETQFEDSAHQVIDTFHQAVERNIAAVASLSASITSQSLAEAERNPSSQFPSYFATLADFELQASNVRAISGSHLLTWCPLITDENREAWEEYSLQNRFHSAEAYEKDNQYRAQQDQEFANQTSTRRRLVPEDDDVVEEETAEDDGVDKVEKMQGIRGRFTTLDDGTHFHPKIWSVGARGAPPGDEPPGGGSYFPVWQQSPVDALQQATLNINIAKTNYVIPDLIKVMTTEKKAVMNYAVKATETERQYFQYLLSLSQYRNSDPELFGDWHTLMTYPVFDSFDDERNVVGVISTDIYWKVLFSQILSHHSVGIVAVIENSEGKSMSFQLDGPKVTSLGEGDRHEPVYDHMMIQTNINSHLEERARPKNRAYKTVSLSDRLEYTIRVFPSEATEGPFLTYKPMAYTLITIFAFFFAALLFLIYSYVVERRHNAMTVKVIEQIKKASETERELNEFLSHEIRNPLSAAMSACTFVATAVNEAQPLQDEETQKHVREDVEVVNASLHFINDFLRSMLDIYQAAGNQITVQMAPTDILEDILKPVSNILYKRLSAFEVLVVCPENVIVMTDSIRLKQVILNLVRNASKFVEKGFLRVRADVVNGQVRIYVEDSGPGVPLAKQKELFAKYQESLDLLSQGTGIGLNLSKKLMEIMQGDLWLDETYHSGIEGCPGACFVVDLQTSVLQLPEDETECYDLEKGFVSPGAGTSAQGSNDQTTTSLTDMEYDSGPDIPGPHCQVLPKPMIPPVSNEPILPEGVSVLFVDDDAMLRKLFMRAIKRVAPTSWTLQEASSGETALKLCESNQFSLIFLDQYMASVDKQLLGTETAQSMRAMGVKSKICGLSANDLRDAFITSGADDFVLKPMPCKPLELKQLLQKILSPLGFVSSLAFDSVHRAGVIEPTHPSSEEAVAA